MYYEAESAVSVHSLLAAPDYEKKRLTRSQNPFAV